MQQQHEIDHPIGPSRNVDLAPDPIVEIIPDNIIIDDYERPEVNEDNNPRTNLVNNPHVTRCFKVGKVAKDTSVVIVQSLQWISIAYSGYVIVAFNPDFESKWGYGFIMLSGVTGAITEILRICQVASEHQHHNIELIKEAVAGACVAAVFVQNFLNPNTKAVILGTGLALSLATTKSLLDIFRNHRLLQTETGKAIQYSLGGAYNLLMGAGLVDYIYDLGEGFGLEVDRKIKYGVMAGLAATNFLAGLPMGEYTDKHKKNICYQPARFYRALAYAVEITGFMTIFQFDCITDIQKNTVITDEAFYGVVSASLTLGLTILLQKLLYKTHEKLLEGHSERDQEIKPLLPKKDNPEELSYAQRASNYIYSFWRNPEDKKLDQAESLTHKKAPISKPLTHWFWPPVKSSDENNTQPESNPPTIDFIRNN